ncbi:S-layer homology domain-containing protein [Fusibacter paucivorans]|uniref:S-layer homology domain-containing protein n=1 Tax=Fusibacter paucivorans TaxID=76009 RepID=A0ABS5PP34_9FIRM|nr:S-layer homology domain-containing protein [Fusibacter paucivorans]MBS7526930.1 S-layer homology domain-containing protein [Fusibacter paucivorans]
MARVIHMIRRRQSFLIKMILFIITATLITAPAHISVAATDIEGHWAEQSINKWLDEGIVSGYADGSFQPDAPMTKAEFITVLNHIYGFYEATAENYSDVDENDWFYAQTAIAKNSPYMAWCIENTLGPNEKITRQEVSAMLASIQVLKASDDFGYLSQFTDHQMIPEWSKPYLDACVANGYLSGYPDKCLHPTDFITRAEVMTVLDKTTGHLIHQNGTYCADHGVKTYDGNLTINTESASLENMLIKGNLILAAGIGQGDVNLNNITVEGKTIINGGGDHSITFTNSHLGELLVYKQDGRIHVVSAGSTVGNTILMSSASLLSGSDSQLGPVQIIGQARTVTLEGNYDQVSLEAPVDVKLSEGTVIEALAVSSGGDNSHIDVGTQSSIGEVTFDAPANIIGEGSIENAVVNVNGVTIEQKVDKLTVADHVNDFASNTASTSRSERNTSNDNNSSDTTAPSGYQVFIDQSVINSSNASTLSFHFEQAEINAGYTYTLSNTLDETVISGSGTITSADQQVAAVDISSLSDGTISLSVQLTDASGNAGNASTDTVIKDVAAPTGYTAAFDLVSINDNAKDDISFTLNSAEVGATCAYTIDSDGGGTAITGNLPVTDANQQISGIDVSTLSDGTLTLSVILTDPALNTGTATTDTAKKDTVPPSGYSIVIGEAYMNNANQNALAFTFSGAEIGAQYEYTLVSDGGTGTITDTGTLTSSDQQVSGIDTSTLSDGQLTLSVKLTDPFGNVGSDVNDTVLKDVAAPAGYTAAFDLTVINNNTKDDISFTLNSAEVGATCAYTIGSDGGGTAITGNLPVTDANQQISGIDVSSLPDGTLTLSVILTDPALNAGATATDTVSKDTVAPNGYSIAIDQTQINSSNKTALAFTFSSAEIGTQFDYAIISDGGIETVTDSGTITSTDQQITPIDLSSLSDGTLTLSVTLTDSASNTGSTSTDTVIKDTIAPIGYSVVIGEAYMNNANQNALAFTFSGAEIGAQYEYTLISDGGVGTITDTGTLTSSDQQVSGIDTSTLSDGQLTLSVKLTDSFGNVGSDVNDTVIKDIAPPAGYTAAFDLTVINNNTKDDISFTLNSAEVGATCAYTIGSDGGGTAITGNLPVTDANQQISGIDVSSLPDGTLTLSVILTDPALNAGATATDTVSKDTVAPNGYSIAIGQTQINSSNKTALAFTFSSAEIGTQFDYAIISDGGIETVIDSGTITSTDQQITPIDLSSLSDGTLTLSVTLTDSASNTGSTSTDTVIKDTMAPSGYSVAIGETYMNNANQNALAFTFASAEVGTHYEYTIISDGGTGSISNTGTITSTDQLISNIDVSSLPDGILTLSAKLTDTALNVGVLTSDTVSKDTEIPSGYSISIDPAQISASNQAAFAFTFSDAEIGTQFDYSIVSDGGTETVTGSGTVTSANQQISAIDVSSLSDGTLTLSVTLTDSASNTGSASTDTVIKDTIAPSSYSVVISESYMNHANQNALTFTFSGAELGAQYEYTLISDGGTGTITDTGTLTSSDQQVSGIDTSTLSDGQLTLSVRLTDPFGNVGSDVNDTVIKDIAAPTGYNAAFDLASINDNAKDNLSFTLNSAEVGATCAYTIDSDGGGTAITGNLPVTDANQQISGIDVSTLSDGTLTLSVILTDPALNTGTATTDTAIKDTMAPSGYSVVIGEAYMNNANQNALAFTFSGAEIGAQYEYTLISDGGVGTITDTGTLTSSDQQVSGINTSTLSDGQLTLSVRLTDPFGNVGSDVNDTVIKDVAAPTGYTAAFDLASINDNAKDDISFTLNSAEVGATCAYTISSDGGGTAITGNLTVTDANQQISGIDVSTLSDGTLTLSVILTDPALNAGTATTDTAIKDTVPPNGYSLSIDPAQISASNQAAFAFTFSNAEIGTQFDYSIGSDGGTEAVTGSGTVTSANQQISAIDVSSLSDGTLTLSVTLTDSASNTGSTSTDTVIKDTIAPSGYSVVIGEAYMNNANQNALAFTFSGAEIGAQYEYTLISDGGMGTITDTGTLTSSDQQVSGIDTSTLSDGQLTLSVKLTDSFGNVGSDVNDTVLKDVAAPAGYTAAFDLTVINNNTKDDISFTLNSAEVGATCAYSISSDGGGTAITGNLTITDANQQISGIDVSSLPDGTLTLSVILTDPALNAGAATTDTAVKDTAPPSGYSIAIDQTQINVDNQSALSFTFSSADIGAEYTYTITSDGNAGASSVTNTGIITSSDQQLTNIDVAGLPDGLLTVSAILTDDALNSGVASTDTINKDTTAPVGYSAAIDNTQINIDSQTTLSFTFDSAEVSTQYAYTVSSDGGGGTITNTGAVTDANQQIDNIDVSTLPDGLLTLSVNLTDVFNNTGSNTEDTVIKDTVAPVGYSVAIDLIRVDASNETNLSFTLTGAEVGAACAYTISSDGGGTPVTGNVPITDANQQITGINVSTISDGTLTLSVVITDTALNDGLSTSDTVIKDTTAPVGYGLSIDNAQINNSNQTLLSFTFSDAEIGTQYTYTITSDGGVGSVTDTGTISAVDQQISGVDVTALPDGTLTLSAILTDTFNNAGGNTEATVLKDVVAPSGYSATFDEAYVNHDHYQNTAFSLSDAEIGATCFYTIDSDGSIPVTGNVLVTSTNQQISSLDVSGLFDGTLTLAVFLSDTAQNDGSTITDTTEKDTVMPSGHTVAIDEAQINTGNQDAFSFTFTSAEVGTQYAYTITSDGGAGTVTGTDVVVSANQQIAGIDVTALPDGLLALSVTLTDDALNTSTAVSDQVTKDTTIPSGYSAAFDTPVNADNQTNIAFTFTNAEVGTQYEYTIVSDGGGGTITDTGTVTSTGQQITGINVSTLPDGILTLAVKLSDTFGNIGSNVTNTTQKDVIAPAGYAVNIDLPSIDVTNHTNFTFTLSSAEIGTTCLYTVSSSGGGTDVTGNITVSNATEQISGIDVSSLPDGDLTLSVILRDPAQNDGTITSDIVTKDTTAPSGYSVAIDPTAINIGNQNTLSFTFASAEVGTQYTYTITSDGGAGTVTNTGMIATATDQLTSIDVSALPDGILTLSVTLTDASGNVGSEATDTILKDIVAPSGYGINIDLAYVNLNNETAFAFTFDHAEVGATCFYTISSSGGGTPVTGNALITSSDQQMTNLDVSGLSDGTLTLSVFLSDTAQNDGSAITDTAEKDTAMPSGHTVAIDEAQINTGNQDAFSFTFTSAEVGTQYAYTITSDGGAGTVTDTGAVTSANQQIAGIDVTALPDGLLALSVTLTDNALNTSTAVSDQVTKDTTIPSGYSAAFDAPVNADNQTNIAFTFTNAEVGTQYEYTIVSDTGGGTITDTGTVTSTGQQITGINVSTLPDGILTLAVKLSDTFGNIGSNVTNTTQKDVIAPVGYGVSIDLANVDDTNHTNFTFTLNGAEVGATCAYAISSDGGGTDVTGNTLITNSDQQISGINVSTLPDGILTLDIALKDTALNTGNTITDTITKDAEPPSGYSIQFDQNYVNNTNKNAVSLSFASAEIGATYTYTIISDSGVETITDSGTITAEDQQVASIDVSTLSDGTLTVTAALTDAVGHVGSDVTANVDKDVVLPTGYGVSIDQTRINTTNLNQFSFALNNAELGTTCHYAISSDGGGTDITDSMTITSENQQTSNIDVSTLPDGTLTLSVTLTDAALNEGALSTDTVVKDTTAPGGYSVSFYQSNIHPQNRSAIAFDFTSAEVGTTYAYTVSSSQGGTPITGTGTVSASSERIGSIDTSGLSDGTITISYFLTDQDNNIGNPVTDTIRKSPYADIEVIGYDIFYNADETPSNVPGNGIYTYNGMENGKPSYIFVKSEDDTYLIHWYDSGWGYEWNITNISEGSDYIYYFNQTVNPTPPTGNWHYTTAESTTDPDLTVTVVEP